MGHLKEQYQAETGRCWFKDIPHPTDMYVNWLETMVEKLTASNVPSAKCYSVKCPAIWFDACTSVKYDKCWVRKSE